MVSLVSAAVRVEGWPHSPRGSPCWCRSWRGQPRQFPDTSNIQTFNINNGILINDAPWREWRRCSGRKPGIFRMQTGPIRSQGPPPTVLKSRHICRVGSIRVPHRQPWSLSKPGLLLIYNFLELHHLNTIKYIEFTI